jgi:hypothetical protein
MLVLAFCFIWFPGTAAAAGIPVAVFPLQELTDGRNEANLPFTGILAEKLAEAGTEIIGLETIISFMANNRIRTVGHLETLFISRVRRDLGAGFVLLGTISQRRDRPEPSFGLILTLVRTSDVRPVWSYINSLSTSDARKILGIGEPKTTTQLQTVLLEEVIEQWPWQIINEEPQVGSLNIDLAVLEPQYVRPGDEIRCRIRLRDTWSAGQGPRVFFKADEQLFPATLADDGLTYETTWVAGDKNGRFPVTLFIEWPYYGRTETTLLGNYVVDGTPPLFELDLRGVKIIDEMPVFSSQVAILPRMIVREPVSRWHLTIYNDGDPIGDAKGEGNLPERLIWTGRENVGDGIYDLVIEAWDKAGNSAIASREVVLDRSVPQVDLALDRSEEDLIVNLEHDGKVPLRYWRLEMWTKEGRILTQTEGRLLPVTIGIEMPDSSPEQEVRGFLFYEDIRGKRVRKKVQDLLPKLKKKGPAKKEEPTGISEKWVDEF